MITNLEALERTLYANCVEDSSWLLKADMLQEAGDETRAEEIRKLTAWSQMLDKPGGASIDAMEATKLLLAFMREHPADDIAYFGYANLLDNPNNPQRDPARAKWMRLQCLIAALDPWGTGQVVHKQKELNEQRMRLLDGEPALGRALIDEINHHRERLGMPLHSDGAFFKGFPQIVVIGEGADVTPDTVHPLNETRYPVRDLSVQSESPHNAGALLDNLTYPAFRHVSFAHAAYPGIMQRISHVKAFANAERLTLSEAPAITHAVATAFTEHAVFKNLKRLYMDTYARQVSERGLRVLLAADVLQHAVIEFGGQRADYGHTFRDVQSDTLRALAEHNIAAAKHQGIAYSVPAWLLGLIHEKRLGPSSAPRYEPDEVEPTPPEWTYQDINVDRQERRAYDVGDSPATGVKSAATRGEDPVTAALASGHFTFLK